MLLVGAVDYGTLCKPNRGWLLSDPTKNMDSKARARDRARKLEAAGKVDTAVRLYLEAGGFGDAVRALTTAERWSDAGQLVLDVLQVSPDEVEKLEGQRRNHARRAAQYFESGGETDLAMRLFRALGDRASVKRLRLPKRPAAPRSKPRATGTSGPSSGACATP